ncbi:MAG: TfoX/Sxy family protein [Pseudomonadota bacterium]
MTPADVEDLLAPIVPVSVRAMFGGHGIYADGRMFALIAYGELFMKTDKQTIETFRTAGSEPFVHESKKGKTTTSYWQLPAEAYDDEETLRRFTGLALEAAQRAGAPKKRKKSPRKKTARKEG